MSDLTPAMLEWTNAFNRRYKVLTRNSLWRLRNNPGLQAMAFDHVEYLHSKGFGHGTLVEFLVACAQLNRTLNGRDLVTATPNDWQQWNNAPSHQTEILRPTRSGPVIQTGTWHVSHRSRVRKQRLFVDFHVRRLRRQGVPEALAKIQAQAIVTPHPACRLPPPKAQRWATITEAQFQDLVAAVPRMRVSDLERVMIPFILHVLHENGARGSAILPCTIGHVDRDSAGNATGITPPIGRGNKLNPPLTMGDRLPSLQAWLQAHPDKDNHEAPLLVSPQAWEHGEILPLIDIELKNILKRLAKAAGVPGYLGVRCFRRLHHAEAAVSGASDADMRLLHGHSETSPSPGAYTRFDHDQSMRLMARIRGIPLKRHACSRCRNALRPGDLVCTWCAEPAVNDADATLLQDQATRDLEAAGRLALECLDQAEEAA